MLLLSINNVYVESLTIWTGLNDRAVEGTFVYVDGSPDDFDVGPNVNRNNAPPGMSLQTSGVRFLGNF